MLTPLVFLCGHRKCGTTLLANLLDGHSALAVYPNDLALLYAYFPHWVATHADVDQRRRRLRRILFDDLAERIASTAGSELLNVSALAERFFAGLEHSELDQPRALIGRLVEAFLASSEPAGRSIAHTVLKETSIEIYAAEILEWFPDARFIQIVRDPRDNFAALAAGVESHYARLGEDRDRTLASLLHRARLGLRFARINSSAVGSARYHVLRFEDLVADPDSCLRTIAEFLGIGFEPGLLAPTVLGRPTRGNNYDGEAKFSIDERNAGRWRQRISADEAKVIEFHIGAEMREFGYEPAFADTAQARAAAEYYKWQNYAYFYADRFASPDLGRVANRALSATSDRP